MGKILSAALAGIIGFGVAGTAMATPATNPCVAQLQAELTTLQAQVAALKSGAVVATDPGTAADIPSGG